MSRSNIQKKDKSDTNRKKGLVESLLIGVRRARFFSRRFHIQYFASLLLGFLVVLTVLGYSLIDLLLTKPIGQSHAEVSMVEDFCMKGLYVFPDAYESYDVAVYSHYFKGEAFFIDDIPLVADELCFSSVAEYKEGVNYNLGVYIPEIEGADKRILGKAMPYADVVDGYQRYTDDGVNLSDQLTYKLDSNNTRFEYRLSINENETLCTLLGLNISCPLDEHKLVPSLTYEYAIRSYIGDEYIEDLVQSRVKIKSPTELNKSTLVQNQVIYNHAPKINMEFSKEIESVDTVTISSVKNGKTQLLDNEKYNISYSYKGKSLQILIGKPLPKSTNYALEVGRVMGIDGSSLPKPISIKFATSDGPDVTYSSVTSSEFPTYQSITLGFDEQLKSDQSITDLITITPEVNFSTYINDSHVVIDPVGNLEACTNYRITVKAGVTSLHGITGSTEYSRSFKTSCARIGVIGYSVLGRPIYAYYLGTGSRYIVYYGAMHGSEANTKTLLEYWISELEQNYSNIPKDITVVVVPNLNPDGVSSGSRFNNNVVDLNRNFNTSDWQPISYFIGTKLETGGGSEPFSEPESRAIANLLNSVNPYLTLSYHSAAAYVVPNSLSTSIHYGQLYAQKSGYAYIAPSVDDAFEYSITGSFGQWSAERGRPSLTIELATAYSSEISTNFPAMWAMIK